MSEINLESLLLAWQDGDDDARNRLVEILHPEMAAIASAILRREYRGRSVCTHDLLNDAVIRLFNTGPDNLESHSHLLALCAYIMRRVLIDQWRRSNREKRKGAHVTLSTNDPVEPDFDLIKLDEALMRLRAADEELAEIALLRYFGGMTIEEIAEARGVSASTVERGWAAARIWLREKLSNEF